MRALLEHRITLAITWVVLAYEVAIGLWFELPLFSGIFLFFCMFAGVRVAKHLERWYER